MFLYNVDIIQIWIVSLESVHFMWLGKITSKFICQDLSFISITSGVNDCIWVVRNWLSAGQVCAVLWLVAQSCLTLRDPMDCTPPGSSNHGILQARILEWAAMSSSRGSSQPRDWTQVSRIAGRFFTVWVIREAWEGKFIFMYFSKI